MPASGQSENVGWGLEESAEYGQKCAVIHENLYLQPRDTNLQSEDTCL